jgi:hypothetical protein
MARTHLHLPLVFFPMYLHLQLKMLLLLLLWHMRGGGSMAPVASRSNDLLLRNRRGRVKRSRLTAAAESGRPDLSSSSPLLSRPLPPLPLTHLQLSGPLCLHAQIRPRIPQVAEKALQSSLGILIGPDLV